MVSGGTGRLNAMFYAVVEPQVNSSLTLRPGLWNWRPLSLRYRINSSLSSAEALETTSPDGANPDGANTGVFTTIFFVLEEESFCLKRSEKRDEVADVVERWHEIPFHNQSDQHSQNDGMDEDRSADGFRQPGIFALAIMAMRRRT